jgi:hypothetical protein
VGGWMYGLASRIVAAHNESEGSHRSVLSVTCS